MNIYVGGGAILLFMILVTVVLIGQSKKVAKLEGAQKVLAGNG